jgi:DNA-binding transcriptional LysR family regulator
MDKFQSLQLFVRVVENGSFSLTAREASLSQATVSKQVSELEHELKTKLLSRTTRQLHLTEAGEKFYKNAKLILEQYSHAVGEVRNLKQQPAGTLRLASSIIFGRKYITPILPRFMKRYPDIVIEHYLKDSLTDLVQEGIDLSIRIGDMKDSSYQARRIGLTKRVTVASKEFVIKHGAPKHPRDLEKLPCLIYLGSPNPFEWKYLDKNGKTIAVNVDGPYRVNVSEAIREAILAGMGIFYAPIWLFGDELDTGKLVSLLTDYDSHDIPVHAVMPASNYIPQKTRAMIDFLAEEFKSSPWLSDYGK